MKIETYELFDIIKKLKELNIEQSDEMDKLRKSIMEKNNIIKHQDSVIDSIKNEKNITLNIIKNMDKKDKL